MLNFISKKIKKDKDKSPFSINQFKQMLKLSSILLVVVFFSTYESRSVRDLKSKRLSPLDTIYSGNSTSEKTDPSPDEFTQWDFELHALLAIDEAASSVGNVYIIEYTNSQTGDQIDALFEAYNTLYIVEYNLDLALSINNYQSTEKKKRSTNYDSYIDSLRYARAFVAQAADLVETDSEKESLESAGAALDEIVESFLNSQYNYELTTTPATTQAPVPGDNSPLRSFYGGSSYEYVDADPETYNQWDFEVETLLALDTIAASIYDIYEVTNQETDRYLAYKLSDAYYAIYMVELDLDMSVSEGSTWKRSITVYSDYVSLLQNARTSIADAESMVEDSAVLEAIGSQLDSIITSFEYSEYNGEVTEYDFNEQTRK